MEKKPGKPGFFLRPLDGSDSLSARMCLLQSAGPQRTTSPDADSAPARLRPLPGIDRLPVFAHRGRREEEVHGEEERNEPRLQRFLYRGEFGLAQGQYRERFGDAI